MTDDGLVLMLECSLQREQKLKEDLQILKRTTRELFSRIGVYTDVNNEGELVKVHSSGRAELDVDEINKCIQMGLDFDKILKEIKSNETLFKQWERLLVTMKMVQQ